MDKPIIAEDRPKKQPCRIQDIKTGDRFGRLTVIKEIAPRITPRGQRYRKIKLICDCGNTIEAFSDNICRGNTKSCGCLHRDIMRHRDTTHGFAKHPLFGVWAQMNSRCNNPKNISFKDYGDRGITVCDEWQKSISVFIEWALRKGWIRGLCLDRKDNDKGYSPENCRFVDRGLSSRNQRLLRVDNKSGFRGVYFYARNQKWHAQIMSNGKKQHLGYYSEPTAAAKAYDQAARKLSAGHPLNFSS